jgi:MFS family permease
MTPLPDAEDDTSEHHPPPYGREFRLYATGQAISLVGDRLALIALVFLVIRFSGSYAPALAVFYIARVIPTLVTGLVGGYIADSGDRKKLLITFDVVRAALLMAVPLCIAVNLVLVYPVVALLYGASMLFNATSRAMLPDVVPPQRITDANALLVRIESGADLAYAAGGGLVAAVQLAVPFYIDAATFAVSAIAISLMHIPSPKLPFAQTVPEIIARIQQGIAFLMGQPFLKWSTISSLIAPLCIGGVFVVSPLYASHTLAHSHGLFGPLHSGAFRFGVLEIAIGVGGFTGSFLVRPLAAALPRGAIFALGMTSFGVVVGVLALIHNVYLAVGVMALSGVCNSLFQIAGATLTQTLTPTEMRGRVMAARITVIQGGLAVGSALAGLLLLWLPIQSVWLVLGALMVAASATVWLQPVARNER